jgi:hypothetical protein
MTVWVSPVLHLGPIEKFLRRIRKFADDNRREGARPSNSALRCSASSCLASAAPAENQWRI